MRSHIIIGSMLAMAATAAVAAPVEITTRVLSERRQQEGDGTVSTTLVPAGRVVPGDRVVYQIAYRNTGTTPVRDILVSNPVPAQLIYGGPVEGSTPPEVSTDGTTFAPLSALRVQDASGTSRAATMSDVRAVRWRITDPVAGGATGQLAFTATLK